MGFAEVFREVEALAAAGIVAEYAIGGAVGATFYLEPIATQDIDVFVALVGDATRPLIDISPILEFLVARGAALQGEHVMIGGWMVQILVAPSALVEDAIRDATPHLVDGEPVRVMSALHLAAIALETGRPKDRLRLLHFLDAGVVRRPEMRAIAERYGLLSAWDRFERQVLEAPDA